MFRDINKRKETDALSYRKRKDIAKNACFALLNKACKCGYSDVRALQIDHIKGGGVRERRKFGGGYWFRVLEKLIAGSKEYQVLCSNCNFIKRMEFENKKRRY